MGLSHVQLMLIIKVMGVSTQIDHFSCQAYRCWPLSSLHVATFFFHSLALLCADIILSACRANSNSQNAFDYTRNGCKTLEAWIFNKWKNRYFGKIVECYRVHSNSNSLLLLLYVTIAFVVFQRWSHVHFFSLCHLTQIIQSVIGEKMGAHNNTLVWGEFIICFSQINRIHRRQLGVYITSS